MAQKSSGIYVATTSFACEIDGYPVNVSHGERVREGHDLLRLYPQAFEPLEAGRVHYDVEQATAAPGEKRGTPSRSTKE